MKYSKVLAFMAFFYCFFSIKCLAQNKQIDTFIFSGVLQDEKTEKIIRHYIDGAIESTQPSNHFITDEKGNIKNIGPSKYMINYHDDYLSILDATEGKIIKYNADLEKINEFQLKYPDGNVYAVEGTNNIILTDEFELSGSVIEFYSSSNKLLNSIRPHPNREFFRIAAYQSNSDITSIILFFQNQELCPQLIQLDSKTGEIKLETCLDLPKVKKNYTVHNVKITKKYMFIPTYKKFMVFDNKGNFLWEKPIYPAKFDYDRQIHIFDSKTQFLSSIQPATGETIWKKEMKSYLNSSELLVSEIISDDSKVNLLLGTRKGNKISNNIILDKEGEFLEKIKFSNTSSKRFVLKEKKSGDILLIDNNKTIRYE